MFVHAWSGQCRHVSPGRPGHGFLVTLSCILQIAVSPVLAQSSVPAGSVGADTGGSTTSTALESLLAKDASNRAFRALVHPVRWGTTPVPSSSPPPIDAIIGRLSDPRSEPLEEIVRAFMEANRAAVAIQPWEVLSAVDVQDKTPVRLVRFQYALSDGSPMPDREIQVTLDGEGRVIGFTARPYRYTNVGWTSPCFSSQQVVAALSEITEDGTWLTGSARPQAVCEASSDGKLEVRTHLDVSVETSLETRLAYRLVFGPDGALVSKQRLDTEGNPVSIGSTRPTIALGFNGNVFTGYPNLVQSHVPLQYLTSRSSLEGLYVKTHPHDGSPATPVAGNYFFTPSPDFDPNSCTLGVTQTFDPDFLQVNVYHHVGVAHDLAKAYGTDRLDFQILADVMNPYDPQVPNSRNNAYYSHNIDPKLRSINFDVESVFHPAADVSVVYHEYAHAIFYALTGGEPPGEEGTSRFNHWCSLGEGFADFVACHLLDCYLYSYLFSTRQQSSPRNLLDEVHYANLNPADSAAEPHERGKVFSSFAWRVRTELGQEKARNLILGAVQLAPRPIDFHTITVGLLLADLYFYSGANRTTLEKLISEWEFPLDEYAGSTRKGGQ